MREPAGSIIRCIVLRGKLFERCSGNSILSGGCSGVLCNLHQLVCDRLAPNIKVKQQAVGAVVDLIIEAVENFSDD